MFNLSIFTPFLNASSIYENRMPNYYHIRCKMHDNINEEGEKLLFNSQIKKDNVFYHKMPSNGMLVMSDFTVE